MNNSQYIASHQQVSVGSIERTVDGNTFTQHIEDFIYEVMQPIKSFSELLEDTGDGLDTAPENVAKTLVSPVKHCEMQLYELLSIVENHLGHVLIVRAGYKQVKKKPETPIALKVPIIKSNGDDNKKEHCGPSDADPRLMQQTGSLAQIGRDIEQFQDKIRS